MSFVGRLYRAEQQVDFPALWKRALIVSVLVVLVSLLSFVFRGLNLGIEFEGGTSWEVFAPETSVAQTRDALAGTGAEAGKIQTVGGDSIRVRADIDDAAQTAEVTAALAALADVGIGEVSVTTVGPSWGDQITSKARNALIWFFVIIAIYIAIRLEWRMSVGALIAVTHDIIISVGFYSLFQFEVTPATVIAFLTIMGYSLYDTIVVYDKVREIGPQIRANRTLHLHRDDELGTKPSADAFNQHLHYLGFASVINVDRGCFTARCFNFARVRFSFDDRYSCGFLFLFICGRLAGINHERT